MYRPDGWKKAKYEGIVGGGWCDGPEHTHISSYLSF